MSTLSTAGTSNALVEQVDGEDDADRTGCEVMEGCYAVGRWAVPPHRDGGNTMLIEVLRHEPCVVDADAEAQRAHGTGIVCQPQHLLQHGAGPRVSTGVEVAEGIDVVALAAAPRDVGQVEPVEDAEVRENANP